MKPLYWDRAARELADRDPVLRALIARFPDISLQRRGDAFATLARAIVGQQISVKAAESVWQRLLGEVGSVTPPALAGYGEAAFRAAGLSRQKAAYLSDLAGHFLDGSVNVERWGELDDEAIVVELTQVRGIGRWTAEMFLIFHLQRPDVFPLDDLGLQRAVSLSYGRGRKISARRLRALGGWWTPWRSVATWYLWRSLDPIPVEY
ncbi:MAG: DNA-3-methyladenine glycosylase 2 family protein [Betaproteobacteria bacterium]|nr:DNA-3-methyladenine glycosylase 2 family protein [Betaproteobacteria bacterium]